MSVKIVAKEKLDANAYNKIIIREVDSNFFVRVSGDKLGEEYDSISYKLSDEFKKIGDDEKIILIVDSFLENASIDSIELDVGTAGCSGKFMKVSGTRELYIQIFNNNLMKSIVHLIKRKYERDRYNYCALNKDNNLYSIRFSNKGSSYERKFVPCEYCNKCEEYSENCPKYIEFKLMYNGKIISFEKKFIERFIYDKLWEVGLNASVVETLKDIKLCDGTLVSKIIDGYSIVCGDVIINFNCSISRNAYVSTICNNIVNKYNNELSEIEKVKKRQLKMEGF